MLMTYQKANFLGSIRYLGLDLYSVQEKSELLGEKFECEKPWGGFELQVSHVSTKGGRGHILSTEDRGTSIFYVSLYGSLPFLPT